MDSRAPARVQAVPNAIARVARSSQRERRQLDDLASLEGRLVGADPDAGPVGAGRGVRLGVALLHEGTDELVHEVRMRAAVPAALDKRKVLRVVDLCRLREAADRLGKQVGIVGNLDTRGNLGLRLLRRVDKVLFVL